MDEVGVLAISLADDAGVAAVVSVCDAVEDLAIEAVNYIGTPGEVKGIELAVDEDSAGNLFGINGHELDNVLGETGLNKDLVYKPVRRDSI